MNTTLDRARQYVKACPPAVSGSGGHNQTFAVACALVNGFALPGHEALALLREYNRTCVPPWSEKELEHKVKSAEEAKHEKPRAHLVGNTYTRTQSAPPVPAHNGSVKKVSYHIGRSAKLPEPIPDACRQFLLAAFRPGEGISIEQEVINADKRGIPKDQGVVLTQEEWLKKLEEKDGDPNKIWRSTDKTGCFIRINPMRLGGSRDADVTAFRHALIEFDTISIEEQWNLITQSQIPCTAVLHSGNKSLHAWVKVDAKDRAEYVQRVKTLYAHFRDYKIDEKNKNPSRFSRLPGMIRGEKAQTLIALGIGAASFSAWMAEQEAESLGEIVSVDDLIKFDTDQDENSVLGNRWLCRGGSCVMVGQSGIGKSSLVMQMAMTWALGQPVFGIKPAKPLKSLIMQAENDKGDLAEMFQGAASGMSASLKDWGPLRANMLFVRNAVVTGKAFVDVAQRLIERHRPDLFWLDPVMSFFGGDINDQKSVSEFFRNWLNPISEATGVIWMIQHHTTKPPSDKRGQSKLSNDHSYAGAGHSDMTNWARAVTVLQQVDEETFCLLLAKRGRRAGALDYNDQPTTKVYLHQNPSYIHWYATSAPEPKPKSSSRYSVGRD